MLTLSRHKFFIKGSMTSNAMEVHIRPEACPGFILGEGHKRNLGGRGQNHARRTPKKILPPLTKSVPSAKFDTRGTLFALIFCSVADYALSLVIFVINLH